MQKFCKESNRFLLLFKRFYKYVQFLHLSLSFLIHLQFYTFPFFSEYFKDCIFFHRDFFKSGCFVAIICRRIVIKNAQGYFFCFQHIKSISHRHLYHSFSVAPTSLTVCSCQVRNKKKLIFFINGEPLARFPMLLLYNFVFSLLLLIIPSSSLKVIKVPSDFNMLIIIHQHIINEISDYFFIKLIQLTKLC